MFKLTLCDNYFFAAKEQILEREDMSSEIVYICQRSGGFHISVPQNESWLLPKIALKRATLDILTITVFFFTGTPLKVKVWKT